jgi:hypothetical protein
MRVPVYQDDLKRNRGFKSLAKQLQKQWCGPTPISLASAQEILAKACGYQNFHDVEKSSKVCLPGESTPPEAAVRQAIFSAIKATLLPEAWLSIEQKLERIIGTLPLTSLMAFKRTEIDHHADQSTPAKRISGVQPELTEEQLQTVEKILQDSGSLRDQALFACMLGALRKTEFLSARMRCGAAVYGVKTVDININVHDAIPPSHRSTFKQYVKASKLSEGDYLFRAANDRKRPLSPDALRRIYVSWARKANIDVSLLTPHGIRKTTDKYQRDMMRLMGERMGHHPANWLPSQRP